MTAPAASPSSRRDVTGRYPGPRGLGVLLAFRSIYREPHAHAAKLHARYGPLVELPLGRERYVLLAEPDAIDAMLHAPLGTFRRERAGASFDILLGRGLITSEGDEWKSERRRLSPPLSKKHITTYADAMARRAREGLDRALAGPETVDIHAAMTETVLEILVETLFGAAISDAEIKHVGTMVALGTSSFHNLVTSVTRFLPPWWPLALRRDIARARAGLDSYVTRLIEERKSVGARGDDLLSRMIEAVDEDGRPMDDDHLRDETMTMLAAGHDTTANALAFCAHLLATHPEVQREARAEVLRVVGAADPSWEHVARLERLTAVMHETLRLYPSVFMFGREPLADVELAGYRFAKGSQLIVTPWSLHRNPLYFDDPDSFRPERWLHERVLVEPLPALDLGSLARGRGASIAPTDGHAGASKPPPRASVRPDVRASMPPAATLPPGVPRRAYLPFGAGPRVCIGNHFAMLESLIILATWLRECELTPVSGHVLELEPAVVLKPRGGLPLRIRPVS